MPETSSTPARSTLPAYQQKLVQAVYDAFRETGNWPAVRTLRTRFRREMDFEHVCREAGPDLISADHVTVPQAECRLYIRALLYCENAEQDRSAIAALIRFLAHAYVHDNADRISGEEIAQALGLDAATMRRVGRITQYEALLSRSLTIDSDGTLREIALSPDLIYFEDVHTLEDYLGIRDERRRATQTRMARDLGSPVLGWIDEDAALVPEETSAASQDREVRRRELRLQVERMRNMLIAAATGADADTRDYAVLRDALLAAPELSGSLPDVLHTCTRMGEFVGLVKARGGSYQDRRRTIANAFDGALARLADAASAPHDDSVAAGIHDAPAVQAAWRRAIQRRVADPEGAITAARTLLESALKHVLDASGVEYDETADLTKLSRAAAKAIDLAPTTTSTDAVRRILGGCQTVIGGLASLRNELGDAHASSNSAAAPQPRHAELAVNLAGAMGLFLLRSLAAVDDGTTGTPSA